VNTLFDPSSLNVSIGLITVFSRSAWGWFLARLGKVVWTLELEGKATDMNSRLVDLLKQEVPCLIFLDEWVRLRPSSPLWSHQSIQLIVSVDNWKGKPPKEWWSCQTQTLSHAELGGVTDGVFQVHLASNIFWPASVSSTVRIASPPAKLKNFLDGSIQGSRCPIPKEKSAPLGQDTNGLLLWERRGYMVEAPTVYSKEQWVRRRLASKELCAVLDVPRDILKEKECKTLLLSMKIPGKVRAHVVESIREALRAVARKRPVSLSLEDRSSRKRVRFAMDKTSPNTSPRLRAIPSIDQGEQRDTVTVKSAKADDAGVPEHLWDDRCRNLGWIRELPTLQVKKALDTLRVKFFLRIWKRKVASNFWRWMMDMNKAGWWRDHEDRRRSFDAGLKAIHYASQASWWEWDGGSFPFFWRWEQEFVREVRDGIPPRFTHEPPSCMDRQRPNSNPLFAEKERAKVFKVVKRGYLRPIERRSIESLMHYFSVPKGEDDIRMVYDGSKCGLNAATFAPWFAVPTSSSLERMLMPHSVQGDNDFGDMFLN
jgi:hypothetical protein